MNEEKNYFQFSNFSNVIQNERRTTDDNNNNKMKKKIKRKFRISFSRLKVSGFRFIQHGCLKAD